VSRQDGIALRTRLPISRVAEVFRSVVEGTVSRRERMAGQLVFERPVDEDPFSSLRPALAFAALIGFSPRAILPNMQPGDVTWAVHIYVYEPDEQGLVLLELQRSADFGTRQKTDQRVQAVVRALRNEDPSLELVSPDSLSSPLPPPPSTGSGAGARPPAPPPSPRPPAPAPGGGIQFDPEGPERAAGAAAETLGIGDNGEALRLSVVAIDRLHDFYVFEQFRHRQPSPADAWIIDGLLKSLYMLRDQHPGADVREPVREVTHRLRTIATSTEAAGGNAILYRRALSALAELAADVDVDDIFWT
jgi:hypothetical protein